MPRLAPLLLGALLIATLAGCASRPQADSAGSPSPSAPAASSTAAPAPAAPPPPATQEGDLAWTLSTLPCTDVDDATQAQAYRPELDGIAYQSLRLDPLVRGGNYSMAFKLPTATAFVEALFWKGAVGPSGTIVSRHAGILTTSSAYTVDGRVPDDADFVTASSCGAGDGAAHWTAHAGLTRQEAPG